MKTVRLCILLLLCLALYVWLGSFSKQPSPSTTADGVQHTSAHVQEGKQTAHIAQCATPAYAERKIAEAQTTTLPLVCLVETEDAIKTLLATFPDVQEVERAKHMVTIDAPIALVKRWLQEGLAIEGILAFDVEKPLKLYGSVATGEAFVGTAPLQSVSSLDGRGEVVAVIDSGISTGVASTFHPELLPALYGMVVEPSIPSSTSLTPADPISNSHGTHVAGCIVAQGKSYSSIRGSAPGAALFFQRIASGSTLYAASNISNHFERSHAVGASIINCSWGHTTYPSPNVYDAHSVNIDRFVWENPEALICVAAGNDGCDTNGDSIVDASSIYSSEAYAKNALVVGAQESDRPTNGNVNSDFTQEKGTLTLNEFCGAVLAADKIARPADGENPGMLAVSSRGPLSDGRIAPMIVAPGSVIYSTLKNGTIGAMSGTSMATPIVSGAAAVLRQYLREVQAIEKPTAALMRAGLILASETLYPGQFGTGSMLEIPETSPNSVEGWGALHLGKLLQGGATQTKTLGFHDRIRLNKTGDMIEFQIPSVIMFSTLSVALSWIDAPAYAGKTTAVLVNDYDLELVSPSGKTYTLGDHTNPIERLTIDVEDDSGDWTIRVKAHKIATDGSGNLAAIAWQALTIDNPKPLPEPDKTSDMVTLSVTLPDDITPYTDYPVWPAPGTHTCSTNRLMRVFCGAKLPHSFTETSQNLSGWILLNEDETRQQGRSTSFGLQPEANQAIRWYEVFPGATFRLH